MVERLPKNERTAGLYLEGRLYLEGLLDTDEHHRLAEAKHRAELDHQHAGREVDRLHLVVRLLAGAEARQA